MKGVRIFYVLLFVSFAVFAVADKKCDSEPDTQQVKSEQQNVAVKSDDTLVVTARLVEIPGRFPPNDAYNYVYVMKYRVVSVERGKYAAKDLHVGHYNPLIARTLVKDKMDHLVDGNIEKFTVGDKHHLTLIESIDKVWDKAIEDEYYETDLPKFFAVKADIVK